MIYRINEEFFQVELYRETTDTEPCEVIELDVAIHAYHDWQKIVRCKECKWYKVYDNSDHISVYNCCRADGMIGVTEKDYCSYGERSEDEHK